MNEKIEKKKGAITMYNENDYNKYQGGGSGRIRIRTATWTIRKDLIRTAHPHGRRTADTAAIMIPDIPAMPKAGSGVREHIRTGNRTEAIFPQEPGRNRKKGGYMAKRAAESRRQELFLAV